MAATTTSIHSGPTTPKAATEKIATLPIGEWRVSAAGFTLLELLVVLVLVGIIAAVATARFSGDVNRPRMRATASELASVLRQARSEAIVANSPVAVVVDVDSRYFGILSNRRYAIPQGISVSLFAAQSQWQPETRLGEIRFFPDGSSTGGEVGFAYKSMHWYVQVDWLTGRVAVYQEASAQ